MKVHISSMLSITCCSALNWYLKIISLFCFDLHFSSTCQYIYYKISPLNEVLIIFSKQKLFQNNQLVVADCYISGLKEDKITWDLNK
jgi:hypothetical protein